MITSHLDLRLRQNYDYISRSRWERPAVLALRACLRRRRKEVIRLLHRRLAPPGLSGRGVAPASLAVAAAVRAGPDEAEAFAFLVVEEVGVDRGVEEIGRASCRERGCQYVSISGVDVSLKK